MPFTSEYSIAMNTKTVLGKQQTFNTGVAVIRNMYKWFLHMTKAGREHGKTKPCLYAMWNLNYMNLYPLLLCLCHFSNRKK